MTRITITLLDEESEALVMLARKERRSPRQQAAMLVRDQLGVLGILPETAVASEQFQSDETGERNE